MFLLRLSPLIPYNLLNYVLGVYPVTLYQFQIANFGMLPGIIAYVYVGTAVSSFGALFQTNSEESIIKMVMFWSGLAITMGAVMAIIVYTKKELNKALIESENMKNQSKMETEEDKDENSNNS